MRDPSSYRGARRNAARKNHTLTAWRYGPHYDIRHQVKRWIVERNALGVPERIFADVIRHVMIHHTLSTGAKA